MKIDKQLAEAMERAAEAFLSRPKREEPEEQDVRHEIALKRRNALRRCGALGRFTTEALNKILYGDLDQTDAITALSESSARPCKVLLGTIGQGKTVAAGACVADIESTVVWVSADRLLRVFAGLYPESLREQDRILDAHVLVVDELGEECEGHGMTAEQIARVRGQMCEALFRVVNSRQNSYYLTIICGNVSKETARKYYPNPALWSRLGQMAEIHELTGKDMRQ